MTLELPKGILCTDTQEGKRYYRLDRLSEESLKKFEGVESMAIMKKEIIESQEQ